MTRKRRLLLALLVMLCAGAIFAYLRARRVFAYHRQISTPTAAAKLSIRPKLIQPSVPRATLAIDTLYSKFELPVGIFSKMKPLDTWLAIGGEEDNEILLSEVGYPCGLSPDGNFTFYKDALHTYPLSHWQVFAMSEAQFTAHLGLVIGKVATPYADRDVSFFETATTKGIIRYGSGEHFSNVINIAVWDRGRELSQEITITVPDAELRHEIALSIAASYYFTLDTIPDRSKLISLVKQAAESFRSGAG